MDENLFAYTAPGSLLPGYVSINRTPSGDVSVTVRAEPKIYDGVHICAYARDKGKPGRCTAGDDRCNNYCNMAPEKGPMQRSPAPCKHVDPGAQATFVVPAAEWDRFRAA